MYAAFGGSGECLKLLLQHGVDVNARDSTGKTALMFAASAGSAYCVELLVKAGAEVKQLDSTNMSALSWATAGKNILNERNSKSWNGYESKQLVREIRGEFLSCVRILVKSGADINGISTEIKTPLMYAIENGTVNLVKLLLDSGAELKYEQLSTLACSSKFGNACVRTLFERLGKHCAKLVFESESPQDSPRKVTTSRRLIPIFLLLMTRSRTRDELSGMKMTSGNRRASQN